MAAKIFRINYKSDFILTMNSDAGWAIPFCIKFWTGMPSQAYFVGFDGVKYVNCRVGDTPTQLLVMFDDHHLPIGKLEMQIAYHTTIEEFPGSVFDEVTNARDVIVTIDGTDYQVMLDFTGEDAPELEFDLPAYANEAERIQNELQRQQNEADRIAAELQREQATAAAVQGAENVNAQLNGTTLTVTNRQGVSTSVNTKGEQGAQGPVGPEGPQGEQGPQGEKGDTGATGPQGSTGPQGPKGDTGVSINDFVETGETETDTLYNIEFSDGTTKPVAIPKGEKGDQGEQGPEGPQGPMGDVAVITPEQQAAFTMYSEPGQNTNGPMTQKAVTDSLVSGSIISDKMKLHTTFRLSTKKTTASYATALNLEGREKYKIKLRTSASYTNPTYFILQLASGQYEGQKIIFTLPAGSTSVEYDYFCSDNNLQYATIYASGNHSVTYDVVILQYLDIEENTIAGHQQNFVNYFMAINTGVIAIGNSTQSMCIGVEGGQTLSVTANQSIQTQIAFMTSVPDVLSNNLNLSSYIVKTEILSAGQSANLIIPTDVTVLWFNLSTNYNSALLIFQPQSYSFKESINGGYGIEVSNNYASISNTIQEDSFIEKNAYLSITNRNFAVGDNLIGKYLKIKSGECYRIVTDQGHSTQIATMSSIPNTITNNQLSSAIRCNEISAGREMIIRIEEGETILWFNVQTYYNGATIRYDCSIYYAPNQYTEIGNNPLWLIPIYGQSLAIGGDTTRLTTKVKFPTLEYNTEEIRNIFTDNVETSKNGLLDSAIDSFCKDNKMDYHNIHSSIVSFSYGQGSTSIIGLKKGTTLYSNFIAKIQAAYNNSGSKIVVPAFCWVQGEDDRFDTNTNDYKGELVQLRADLDADIKAITGQTEDVHCIVYQTNQLSIGGASYKPNNYASGVNGALMSVPQAQYELIRDNALFHASTPIYMMAYYISSNGYAIHITNESQRLMGYYEGLQAQRLINGGSDIGLYVSSVEKIDSTHIKLNIHTPCPPLVIDTEQVYEVAGYGFSVITSNNENILQSVTIAPNHFSEQAIIIETSSDCTGAKVRYGVNGTIAINSSGFKTGSRGNIRDSQGLEYMADINGKKVPMHNWLYFFEYLI